MKRCGPWPFYMWPQPTPGHRARFSREAQRCTETNPFTETNPWRQQKERYGALRAGRISADTVTLRVAAAGWHTRPHSVGGQLKFKWEECMHKSVDHILTTHT